MSSEHTDFLQKSYQKFIEGRPMNGMFIAVANDITENVLDVSPNHWMVHAIMLKANNNRILIINTYFLIQGLQTLTRQNCKQHFLP